MKKAVVIGGSSGVGLAVSQKLIQKGYFVNILSRNMPQNGILPNDKFAHIYCDLRYLDENLINELSKDNDIEVLFISSGVGLIADFEHTHICDIDRFYAINTVSAIKILRIFYDKIRNKADFYIGVMGSIAGWLSSPAAAAYASSKAGLVHFIEAVNIELEAKGYKNRILDISPGSFKGSKFSGGQNDLSLLDDLSDEIIKNLFAKNTLFIPQYDEIFKNVINDYHADPHKYGLRSYEYKQKSGRINNNFQPRIAYMSGTFDLFHIGHLNILKRAKENCDYLIVGVHDSGKWKGKDTFIPLEERKAIVAACKYVDKVVDSCREDCDAWDLWHYNLLFVGSDYKGTERFQRYEEYFKDKGVKIVYFPYTQGTSSTKLREKINQDLNK